MTSPLPDSGNRIQFSTGMVRDTQDGKARFDLCLPQGIHYHEQMLTRFAQHMAAGAQKYSARNWENASTQEELERYQASALRHMHQWIAGEDDEDHAAAVYFNIMGAEYVKYRLSPASTKPQWGVYDDSWVQEVDGEANSWT
jgi:Domain of unknown function (DUF5664)